MKKVLYVCIILLGLFGICIASESDEKYFEDNIEMLVAIYDNEVEGSNIVVSRIFEYESYYKVFHYTYREDGTIDPGEPIYYKKEDVKNADKFYW